MPLAAMATAPTHAPTDEQQVVIDAYRDIKERMVVTALAGTGKTTTLKHIASVYPARPGLYLAFNKSVVQEVRGTMPGRVEVCTAHSLAYQAVGKDYAHRLPGNGAKRMSAQQMASKLKVRPVKLGEHMFNPSVLVKMAQATVNTFIKTTDLVIGKQHIPARICQLFNAQDIWNVIDPIANKIWADLEYPFGNFWFTHDVYLKLWAMTNPILPFSYLMFDEAQDADPVIASVVARQGGMQKIWVGDENQAIYGWRGATNAMSKIEGAARFPLTQSFRFGPDIADQANLWLDKLGSKLRVVGYHRIKSTVGEIEIPRAILCRGNGTALGWVLAFHERQIPVALAPGDRDAGKDIERFAWGARDLMAGNGSDHPDLVGFPDWGALCKFVDEEEDTADLKRMVGIINRVGVNGVIDAVRGLVPGPQAVVTMSTAHKAKGLEWDSVKVADDFVPPGEKEGADPDERATPEDLMLNYVTVTRAKLALDAGPLANPDAWMI